MNIVGYPFDTPLLPDMIVLEDELWNTAAASVGERASDENLGGACAIAKGGCDAVFAYIVYTRSPEPSRES